jgi:hypothetical protein
LKNCVRETPRADFLAILRTLTKHEVEFIVVGGVCAVLQGAPVNTFDLDVVHSRSADNVERLQAALLELDAHYRSRPGTKMRPETSHLVSPGHQLLMTRFGPMDVLGTIGDGQGYQDLAGQTDELEAGGGVRIQVLKLAALIRVKEEVGAEKDKAVLPILRRVLEEKSRR